MDTMSLIQPAPPDPMAALGPNPLADPYEEDLGFTVGPAIPSWYTKPKKPKPDDVIARARQEQEDHALRLELANEGNERLAGQRRGLFARDVKDYLKGEIDAPPITILRSEHNMACAYISSMDIGVSAMNNITINEEESAIKEDAAHYWFDCEQRQHVVEWGADLQRAKVDLLQRYGMLVGYDAPDFDKECGLDMRLLNPATCFPVYEGSRGLDGMYRIYTTTAGDVVGSFDKDGDVSKKIKKVAHYGNGDYNPNYNGEVIEYWNRAWVVVIFNGEVMLNRDHNYTMVPFTVVAGAWAEQPNTSSSATALYDGRTRGSWAGTTSFGSGQRRIDLSRQYCPFLQHRWDSVDIKGAVYSRVITALRRSNNPAMLWTMSPSSDEEQPEIEYREAGLTKLGFEEELQPMPNLPPPDVLSTVMLFMQQDEMSSTPPAVINGMAPLSQASGTAIDMLTQAGLQSWHPLVRALQLFDALRTERRFEWVLGYGEVMGRYNDRGGVLVPPRNSTRMGTQPSKLTPEIIRRTGTRVEVTMHKFNIGSLPGVASALQILAQINGGMYSDETLVRLSGVVTDIKGELKRAKYDQLGKIPEVLQTDTLDMLMADIKDAAASGDMESAKKLSDRLIFIGSLMQQRTQMMNAMAGNMMNQGITPDPSMQGPNQGAAGGALAGGLPNPQMGRQGGQGGGRPGGSQGAPTAPTAPTAPV